MYWINVINPKKFSGWSFLCIFWTAPKHVMMTLRGLWVHAFYLHVRRPFRVSRRVASLIAYTMFCCSAPLLLSPPPRGFEGIAVWCNFKAECQSRSLVPGSCFNQIIRRSCHVMEIQSLRVVRLEPSDPLILSWWTIGQTLATEHTSDSYLRFSDLQLQEANVLMEALHIDSHELYVQWYILYIIEYLHMMKQFWTLPCHSFCFDELLRMILHQLKRKTIRNEIKLNRITAKTNYACFNNVLRLCTQWHDIDKISEFPSLNVRTSRQQFNL